MRSAGSVAPRRWSTPPSCTGRGCRTAPPSSASPAIPPTVWCASSRWGGGCGPRERSASGGAPAAERDRRRPAGRRSRSGCGRRRPPCRPQPSRPGTPRRCQGAFVKAEPAGAHPPGPRPGRRGRTVVHLAISLAAFAVLGIAQLYAFTRMAVFADSGGVSSRLTFAVMASAFLLFTLAALVRQSALMAFAYGGATSAARTRFTDRPDWPGGSILVPAFNEAGRIEKALEAILAVDYPSLEVIVVDDGSTDDTHARVSRFAGRHGGARVKI